MIIHRDIKPSNILFTGETSQLVDKPFDIALADFGLARQCTDPSQQIYGFVGTEDYMAPEVESHQPYSFAVDIWSAGKVMQDIMKYLEKKGRNELYPGNFDIEKDLLQQLLQEDPLNRLTADQALKHDYFRFPPSLFS